LHPKRLCAQSAGGLFSIALVVPGEGRAPEFGSWQENAGHIGLKSKRSKRREAREMGTTVLWELQTIYTGREAQGKMSYRLLSHAIQFVSIKLVEKERVHPAENH
jgi:hypothetical protein